MRGFDCLQIRLGGPLKGKHDDPVFMPDEFVPEVISSFENDQNVQLTFSTSNGFCLVISSFLTFGF
jgi:hypothetical protein